MADANGLFWNSSNGDRTYNADSFSEWLGKFFTTGIFNGELQVTPAGGMNVNVATGYANIQGKVKFFDTATQFTVPTANSTYPRIDTIVVQADYTNRTISMEYVQGSYSGNNPTPQAPVRDTGIYQLVLAQIRVNAGATEVTTANITDTRANADLCGWVTGTVDHVAVSQLTEQAQAEFAIWFDHMKDQLSEDAAGNLQLEVDTLAGSIAYVEHAIADIDHVKGSYVTIGNQMYKVTAAVTAGDTFEIGVNIELISVGEELTSLNKGLTTKTSGVVSTNRSDVTISKNGCIRCADVVTASAMLTGATPATGSFFNIPSGFRPNQTIAVPVFFTINGVEHTELGTIGADGSVAVVYSSSQQVSRIFFSACYHV